jgi:CRP-like cAMP-binding protein
MSSQRIQDFVQKVESHTYKQGETIFHEGDPPDDTMYFVFAGEVGVYKKRPGGEQEINRLKPGEFFGEMALVHHRPRLATTRIVSPEARLAVMNKSVLLKLAGGSPQFLFNLLRYAISRLLAAEDKLQRTRESLQNEKRSKGMF